MEDGLVLSLHLMSSSCSVLVLILVVVEDGLVHLGEALVENKEFVLILVVVEDGLVHTVDEFDYIDAQKS